MAPLLRPRQTLPKERFSTYFGALRNQPYQDPSSTGARAGGTHNLRSIAWNPIGNLVATGAADKTLRVWNPEKPNVRFSTELRGHAASIEKVAFNPVKDAELCSVSSDGVVRLWDVRTKACVNEVKGLGETHTLAWAPDGLSLVVGNKSGTIHVLSPTLSEPMASHQGLSTNQMGFCWGGKRIFLPQDDGRTRILSYPNFEPVLRLNYHVEADQSDEFILQGHTSSCLAAEMSPTGRYLATGGADAVIALWDTSDWICQRTVSRLAGPVKSISFTFDGTYVVGGCDEVNGLEVTHTETGEHVHSFKTAGPSTVVAWAPTRYCLAYSDVGVLRIIGVDADRK